MGYKTKLAAIAAHLETQMDQMAADAANEIADLAKRNVPVKTGKLRDSIHVEKEGHGEYRVVAGNPEVTYGVIVEFGGKDSGAHPFLIPAQEHVKRDFVTRPGSRLKLRQDFVDRDESG